MWHIKAVLIPSAKIYRASYRCLITVNYFSVRSYKAGIYDY